MLDAETASRVRDALFAQKYNLLLGAGVSLDSNDRNNDPIMGAEALRTSLCELTGSRASSPLWRVAGHLTPEQVETHLRKPFHGCKGGPTVRAITKFSWKTAFTLNIDDALENAYETEPGRLQSIVSVNYTREYEIFRNPQELPLVHLHGFVRKPEDKFIFSLQEYATLQRGLNPWVQVLSGLIVSEPFIIAGTALFEPDLEYFFAHRPSNAEVLARAPSILVEPYPDTGTRKDCERLRLVLVEATLEDFLAWLTAEYGPPPTPLALREPQVRPRVVGGTPVFTSTAFWSEFDFVQPSQAESSTPPDKPSSFMFGRPPDWDDIAQKRDVPLHSQLRLIDEVRRWQASSEQNQVLCLAGRAGAGKTTTIRRVAVELASHGIQVFHLKARGGIDTDSAVRFLSTVADPILLTTDSFAEHGEQLLDIIAEMGGTKRICILAEERQYRMRLVKDILEGIPNRIIPDEQWRIEESVELIRRYSDLGLIGNAAAVTDPRSFANQLAENTAAESVCRILNDFRPLRAIVRSLWNDTIATGRPALLATAVAYYCHPVGVHREIILAMASDDLLKDLNAADAPLRVVEHPDNSDYLLPANGSIAALLVEEMASKKSSRLLEIVVELANELAPFVTRATIKQRSPEARLAGRLFDADGLMPELLKANVDKFYELTHEKWKWNSRYWEQRALFISDRDRVLSIQHARYAVAIEHHPFPMTTLAKVLFSSIKEGVGDRQAYFNEALDLMEETLRIEATWERGRSKKAYWTTIEGVSAYVNSGGVLTLRQTQFVEKTIINIRKTFDDDTDLHDRAAQLADRIIQTNGGTEK
ncbi:P-loop NTPase [Massilia soli]|uniref:SIR2 family protein n=1 Tax=Massilia soli TaxID=2792854 RepID=A0ABS7SNN6_9BURK|nr:SIR2 family protein [Massilia soli]MBZ2207672.1 SIR2 family protein [Massilia soli]